MDSPGSRESPGSSREATTATDLRDVLQMFDELPTGILLMDPDGTVLRVNPVAARHLGESALEILGRNLFREVLPTLHQEGVEENYRRQMMKGRVNLDRQAKLASPEGLRSLWLGMRSFTFKGSPWGVVLLEDRSLLAEEEERRKRAESLASVGELAAGVAHEVNNPLASIKSFAQLLAREASSAEQRRALEIIIQESTRIARVVENLLSFARQQGVSGREPVNITRLSEQVLELRGYALETAGIEVRRDFDASISAVMGEPGALQQVILNLVVNAEQALAAKNGNRLLIVRTRESTEGVVLSVVDNGPGISRALLPQLFDAYGAARAEGAGLGLGISAAIVRDHGGQILAESEEGRGAAFFVRLPRAGRPVVTTLPSLTRALEPPAAPRRALRVLVADDEPTLRLAISLFLSRRGHEVVQAADAHEALALARDGHFDVALVDARMPGDGLALLEELEQMPGLAGRTALMTGDLGRTRTTQGITTGRPFLIKPFDMNEAVSLIEKLGQ